MNRFPLSSLHGCSSYSYELNWVPTFQLDKNNLTLSGGVSESVYHGQFASEVHVKNIGFDTSFTRIDRIYLECIVRSILYARS